MVANIKLYLKIYYVLFFQNIKVLLSYKFDLIFGVVALFLKNASSLIMIYIIFLNVEKMAGYNFYYVLLIQGIASISFGLWHTFFINTISMPYYIKSGEFNVFLTKPIHPIFLIMTDNFDEDGLGDLIYGLALTLISLKFLEINFWMIFPILALSIGTSLIFASLSLLGSTISFFTKGYMDVARIAMDLNVVAKYPMNIFPQKIKFLFYTIFPVAYIAYMPVKSIMDNTWLIVYLVIFAFSLVFFFITVYIWEELSKFYEGTGS